jgi:dynein heavy chain
MYEYSLGYVKRLFNTAIEKSPAQESLQERLDVLIDQITKTMYLNVSRGLFVAHKVLFSFLICTSINRNAEKIKNETWSALLRGAGVFDRNQMSDNPNSSIISTAGWELAFFMECVGGDKFKGLTQHILENS